jgi:YidC/Oxa1 family membrane protein insertase
LYFSAVSNIGKKAMNQLHRPHHAQRRAFGTEIVAVAQTVSQCIQNCLVDFHTWSGLPWWLSIAASTIIVRSATFPLIRQQVIVSRKLAAAMPEVQMLSQMLGTRLKTVHIGDVEERLKLIQVFMKGVKACFVVHGVSIAELLMYPAINISIFVTFVYSVRDMVVNGSSEFGLESGGAFWFEDLSEKDSTYILSLTAPSLTYLALELGFKGAQGRVVLFLKDAIQCMIMLALPVTTQLPAGVFCYWIPSTAFGIVQSQLLKSRQFQKLFGIPSPPLPPIKKP